MQEGKNTPEFVHKSAIPQRHFPPKFPFKSIDFNNKFNLRQSVDLLPAIETFHTSERHEETYSLVKK
jgi:hypothetical protein